MVLEAQVRTAHGNAAAPERILHQFAFETGGGVLRRITVSPVSLDRWSVLTPFERDHDTSDISDTKN